MSTHDLEERLAEICLSTPDITLLAPVLDLGGPSRSLDTMPPLPKQLKPLLDDSQPETRTLPALARSGSLRGLRKLAATTTHVQPVMDLLKTSTTASVPTSESRPSTSKRKTAAAYSEPPRALKKAKTSLCVLQNNDGPQYVALSFLNVTAMRHRNTARAWYIQQQHAKDLLAWESEFKSWWDSLTSAEVVEWRTAAKAAKTSKKKKV
ncbi:hypothetical protein C8R46DRAFT_1211235 [Mycena filopes]|nr:hypothetical protein C8R46DRAFT_1211235 [Mycena filopes]